MRKNLSETRNPEEKEKDLRVYVAPEIVLEIDLETRAGSVLDAVDPLDLTGLGTGTDSLP